MSTPAAIVVATELAPLPTRVVTFCMSDIEGSTRLWERNSDAMLDALVRHTERIAEEVEAHGGRLLRQMGEGDSTVSVFTDPVEAIGAAIAAMRALDDEPSWEATRSVPGLGCTRARRGSAMASTTAPS